MQTSLPQAESDNRLVPDNVRNVLVVGVGKVTGAAVTKRLLELGRKVRVAERDQSEANLKTAGELAGMGAEVSFGDEESLSLVDWSDLVIPSPGVPPANPLIRRALERAVPVWSEIELGWRLARGPVIAITGTNGKTTTTELATGMLNSAGVRATAAGNIGFPLVEAASSVEPSTILVTEVSSFQLAFVDRFSPPIAVVLNVSDDHYDWHTGYADYLSAKSRITSNQGPEDLLIVNARDEGALSIAALSSARVGVFGTESIRDLVRLAQERIGREVALSAGIEEGSVVLVSGGSKIQVIGTGDIRVAGAHNLENVLASSAAAFAMGSSTSAIKQAAGEFQGLPHRMNLVGELRGTRYIDDSKATNPHAARAALRGMSNVVLIAGGRSKGIPLSPLAEAAQACKAVVVMGEAAGELKDVFGNLPVVEAEDVEDAVSKAAKIAMPGDTVLLSPGCSSLDQYSSYAERGDRFVRAVRALG